MATEEEDRLAYACSEAMWENDDASRGLGFVKEEVRLGYARLSMIVRTNMLNGQKICHGGFMFTLADSAFAFACNGRNEFTVAQHCNITFTAPAFEGEKLTAIAQERYFSGRGGIYDCTVSKADGTVVAEMRGHSRSVKGQHLPGR